MSRTFEHFPETATCPLCGTSKDSPCVLIPIDGTLKGSICEAKPIHAECVHSDHMRYNEAVNVVYVQNRGNDD